MYNMYKRKGSLQKAVFFPFFYLFVFVIPLHTQSALHTETLPADKTRGQEAVTGLYKTIEKAKNLHLAEDPYWHTLLHYKKSVSGVCSLIDDPRFFLAKNGKRNPEAELIATLTLFYTPSENIESYIKNPDSVSIPDALRFPARYAWLKEKLDFNPNELPYDADTGYEELKKKVNPSGFYLIFPAGYMKNPASLFGHSFLLIESEKKSRLLAYSVNYGADAQKTIAPLYALFGLTGVYRGYYSFLPYYEKIKEYGDIDMRDMWEYRINLTDDEKDKMLRHIYEMQGIYSRYYFITENCAYNLLFLIEAARPESRITDKMSKIAEPIGAIKLVHDLGLTDSSDYRPSLYRKIQTRKNSLSYSHNLHITQMCRGKKPIDPSFFIHESTEKQALIWDQTADYLKFLLNSGKITPEDYRKRIITVLSARKELGRIEQNVEPPILPPPDKTHGSTRLFYSAGKDIFGFYTLFGWRLTSHDLMDSDTGYTKNSQLTFVRCEIKLRPFAEEPLAIHRLDLFDIISLPVSDVYFFNPCFTAVTGIEANTDKNGIEKPAWRIKFMYGLSALPAAWIQPYIVCGFDSYFSPAYKYKTDLLLGAEAGFITTAGIWKNRIKASVMQSPLDTSHLRYSVSAEEYLSFSQNSAISAVYTFKGDYGTYAHEYGFSFYVYF